MVGRQSWPEIEVLYILELLESGGRNPDKDAIFEAYLERFPKNPHHRTVSCIQSIRLGYGRSNPSYTYQWSSEEIDFILGRKRKLLQSAEENPHSREIENKSDVKILEAFDQQWPQKQWNDLACKGLPCIHKPCKRLLAIKCCWLKYGVLHGNLELPASQHKTPVLVLAALHRMQKNKKEAKYKSVSSNGGQSSSVQAPPKPRRKHTRRNKVSKDPDGDFEPDESDLNSQDSDYNYLKQEILEEYQSLDNVSQEPALLSEAVGDGTQLSHCSDLSWSLYEPFPLEAPESRHSETTVNSQYDFVRNQSFLTTSPQQEFPMSSLNDFYRSPTPQIPELLPNADNDTGGSQFTYPDPELYSTSPQKMQYEQPYFNVPPSTSWNCFSPQFELKAQAPYQSSISPSTSWNSSFPQPHFNAQAPYKIPYCIIPQGYSNMNGFTSFSPQVQYKDTVAPLGVDNLYMVSPSNNKTYSDEAVLDFLVSGLSPEEQDIWYGIPLEERTRDWHMLPAEPSMYSQPVFTPQQNHNFTLPTQLAAANDQMRLPTLFSKETGGQHTAQQSPPMMKTQQASFSTSHIDAGTPKPGQDDIAMSEPKETSYDWESDIPLVGQDIPQDEIKDNGYYEKLVADDLPYQNMASDNPYMVGRTLD